jgi:hypothetical protein
MARTFEPVATYTFSSSATSYTFTNVSQAYTDLIITVSSKSSKSGVTGISVQVGNGSVDTGSNYSAVSIYANGSSSSTGKDNSVSRLAAPWSGNLRTPYAIRLLNYSSSMKYKLILQECKPIDHVSGLYFGRWDSSTSAINTIKLTEADGYDFVSGTIFSIYGIKAG